jgi:hypothetical protein
MGLIFALENVFFILTFLGDIVSPASLTEFKKKYVFGSETGHSSDFFNFKACFRKKHLKYRKIDFLYFFLEFLCRYESVRCISIYNSKSLYLNIHISTKNRYILLVGNYAFYSTDRMLFFLFET